MVQIQLANLFIKTVKTVTEDIFQKYAMAQGFL